MQANASSHDQGAAELSQQVGRALERLGDLGSFGPLADALPISDVLPGEASDIGKIFDDDGPATFGDPETAGNCHNGADDDGDGIADDGCGDDPGIESLADRFVDAAGNGVIDTFDGIMDALELNDVDVAGLTVNITEATDLSGVTNGVPNSDGIDYVLDPTTGDIDFAVVIDVAGAFQAPIALPTELVDLVAVGGDGVFDVPIQLTSTPLQFHFDFDLAFDDVADVVADTVDEALWLVMAPDPAIAGASVAPGFDLEVGDGTQHSISGIDGGRLDLGFIGVDLDPSSFVSLQLAYGLSLIDPDSLNGGSSDTKLHIHELINTGLDELVTVQNKAPNSGQVVDAALHVGTDMIDAADDIDLTVNYDVPTFADLATTLPTFEFPGGTPQFDLAFFKKLRSFSPSEALGGVDRLVGMLTTIQGGGLLDIDLPYLDGGTCDNGVDDDQDGKIDDGCLGSTEPAVGPAETGALGGFSDALELGRKLADTIQAALVEPPDPDSLGTIVPTFSNAQELAEELAAALGITIDLDLNVANPALPRLEYNLVLEDSATAPIALRFGDLDIVNDIVITSGGAVTLTADYSIPLNFALDLTPEPTEDGADVGSCTDGEDNGDDGQADGMDTDCAAARTLEERVQVYVGNQADDRPEVDATMSVLGSGITAVAKVGILEVGVTDASVEVGADGLGGDPASISLDISTEANNGWLTIQEFLASLGQPADPNWTAKWQNDQWHRHIDVDAGFEATVPVGGSIGGVELAGGDIVISGGESGSLQDAHHGIGTGPENKFDFAALVDSITVDASDLAVSDIFSFSGCGNSKDDDGDGVVDDGCEGGPTAVEAPESESGALFDQILAAVRLVAGQIDGLSGDFGVDIPLIGKSFEDLVDFAGALADFADMAALGAEGLIPGACEGNADDDGDGYANDGCPQVGTAEGGLACVKGNNSDEDSDTKVNDGCPAVAPTLQQLGTVLDALLTRLIGEGLDTTLGNNDVQAAVKYDSSNNEVSFSVEVNAFEATTQVPLVAGLPDSGSSSLPDLVSLVSANSSGVLDLTVSGSANIAFGLELDDFTPFVLGSTGLNLEATAATAEPGLNFSAGIGPITASVGNTAVTGESGSQCDDADANTDQSDNDNDGFVNDGCGAVGAAESAAQCTYGNTGDDDGDNAVNDGCPARADTARVFLGGAANVDVAGADTAKSYFPGSGSTPVINLTANLGGSVQEECVNVSVAGFTGAKHACAVLPLYLNDTPLPNNGTDHHVAILAEISATPQVKAAYPGADDLLEALAGSVIDLLLLESGIGPLIDKIIAFLSDNLLSVDIPVIGDALDLVLEVAQSLRDGLGGSLAAALSGGDPLAALDPLAANSSEVAEKVQDLVADPLATALANAGILLDSTQAERVPLTATDVANGHLGSVRAITLCGDDEPCDYGLETRADSPARIANDEGDDDPSNNCEGTDDEDGDGSPNDGCTEAVPNGESGPDCDGEDSDDDGVADDGCPDIPVTDVTENNCDGADEDTDGVADDGCTWPPVEKDFEEGDDPSQYCANATDDDGDGVVNDGCPEVFDSASDVTDIAFSFRIGQSAGTDFAAVDGGIGFDSGIPGLGLALEVENLALKASAGWDLDLVIGVSKDHGFYFVTDEEALYGDQDTIAKEFNADAVVRISDPAADPAKLTGSIAFLDATATDGLEDFPAAGAPVPSNPPPGVKPGRSFVSIETTVDLLDPGPVQDNRLTFSELMSGPRFSDMVKFDFGGRAELHLGLSVGVDGDFGEGLPQLVTGLHLEWDWSLTGASSPDAIEPGGPSSDLNIWMDRLYLDAGSFVSEFLGPVFKDIQQFTKAFQPIIDVINTPIPVLSDFAGEPVTMRTLGEALAAAYDIDLTLLDMVIDLIAFVNAIPTDHGSIYIPLTSDPGTNLDLNADILRQRKLPESQAMQAFGANQLDKIKDGIESDINTAVGSIGAPASNQSSGGQLTIGGLDSVGVSFPFLEHPERLAGLLFGQHVTLVQWEPPPLILKFCYSQKFGPIWAVPPVFVEFGGCVQLKGEFGIGYNTKGFERAFWAGDEVDVSGLLQGLFLIDRHPLEGGSDTNELEFRGEIFVNAQVSVLIFSAGAEGKLYITIGIDLQDPNNDGILEFGEAADIIRRTGSVLCIFNLNGALGLQFSVFAEVDLFFWSKKWTKVLADIVLFEFKVECDPLDEPELARPPSGGGTLFLNVGVDAKFRDRDDVGPDDSIGWDTIDETWTVTRTVDGVNVRALGFSQDYPGNWSKVVVTDAGSGDDKIAFLDGQLGAENGAQCQNSSDDDGDGSVNDGCPAKPPAPGGDGTPENCDDSADNDGNTFVNDGCPIQGEIVLLKFDIPVEAHGGDDKDNITGGVAGGLLTGGDGDDVLVARYNNELIGSQLATSNLWTIKGDGDNDSITGSPGNDLLEGGSGDDDIDAGPGADKVVGGDDDDTITGGNDIPANPSAGLTINLPDGVDKIWGDNEDDSGEGRDTIDGGPANDEIKAGSGADRVDGGTGDDKIWGGNETNEGCTTPVDDQIIGGPGSDTVRAEDGDDIVVGGNTIAGQPDVGDALLSGGTGCDIVLGDNAVFNSSTSPRAFTLLDPSIGGSETLIEGGAGDDIVRGQVGNDKISGDTGSTTESGDGHDQIWGDHGNDTIWGNGANDRIYGDGGPSHPQFPDGDDKIAGGGGGDTIDGENGTDTILGDDGTFGPVTFVAGQHGIDTIHGDGGTDNIYGQGSGDFIWGDGDNDEIHGDTDTTESGEDGNDQIRGGTGDDLAFGGDGADQLWGDSGNDRMAGGSKTAGNADSGTVGTHSDAYAEVLSQPIGDRLRGGTGDDTITGDNATFAAFVATLLDESTLGEGDLIYGELGDDTMYGEFGPDFIYGDAGNDHAEGGAAGDVIYGQADQDDLIGGTTQPAAGNPSGVNGRQLDGGDKIYGGGDADVAIGDNGKITQPGGTEPSGALTRVVTLYDLDTKNTDYFGSDLIEGGMSGDDIYGGGDGDVLYGYTENSAGAGLDTKDHIEGNDGDPDPGDDTDVGDLIHGDADQDDLIGGTSAHVDENPDPNPVMPSNGGAHPDDGTDVVHGGDGTTTLSGDYDVILGDNATIERVKAALNTFQFDDLDPAAPAPRDATTGALRRRIVLHDVAMSGEDAPTSPVGNPSAGDELFGDDGWDELYGQGGDDHLEGNAGDDHLEGNAGEDTLYGQTGQDDLIGGTGRTVNDDPATAVNGRVDGSDRLYGGEGDKDGDVDTEGVTEDDYDVEMGDNATVLRGEPGEEWDYNTFNASVRRHVYLYDVGMVDAPAAADTGAGDFLFGEADDDLMYGQTGDDEMYGGSGDDAMQGNDGADSIVGATGNDDMVGGTGRINDDPVQGTPGRLDVGEVEMRGEEGHDWIAGDNAIVERVLVSGQWVADPNGGFYRHVLRMPDLFDHATPNGGSRDEDQVSGPDNIFGDDGNDVMYGQGNRALADDVLGDELYGGAGQDHVEGNEGGDMIEGGGGEDDLVGGTGKVLGQDSFEEWVDAVPGDDDPDFDLSDADDEALNFGVRGRHDGDDLTSGETGTAEDSTTDDGDADVIAGDNAVVIRPVPGNAANAEDGQFPTGDDGLWQSRPENDSVLRWIWFPDVESIFDGQDGQPGVIGDHVHGDDDLYGNEGDDEMWGQGGDDLMYGGIGDDRMQGNHASDEMYGGPDQDDMNGGTGRINNDPEEGTPGRLDEGDLMYGQDAHDVMTGDNAIVHRPVVDDDWVTLVYLGYPDSTHAANHVAGKKPKDNVAPVAVGAIGDPLQRFERTDRILTMIDLAPDEGGSELTAGSDLMSGGAGDDDMVGQFDDSSDGNAPFNRTRTQLVGLCDTPDESTLMGDGIELEPGVFGIATFGDVVCGNAGEDAILGDQGVIENRVEDGSRQQLLKPNVPFVADWIFLRHTMSRLVTLDQWEHGGHDVILGGDHHDSVHAGAGGDLINGDDGDDFIFGDDGGFIEDGTRQDALWGGRGHDTTFAGFGDDFIDVQPRTNISNFPDDPDDWFFFAPPVDGNGFFRGFASIDHHYGGWDQDAHQADLGDNGPVHGDRLMDWVGAHNVYYLCPSTYGAWVSLRDQPPGMIEFLEGLATGLGAVGVGQQGTSGYDEAAIVYKPDNKFNNTPPHPDTPGHFICEGINFNDPTAG